MGRMTAQNSLYWLLAVALGCVLWPVLYGDFLWDDYPLIVDNSLIRRFDWGSLRGMLFSAPNAAWQPLGWLVYACIHAAAGENPAAYHFAGLSVHILACVSLARLCAALPGGTPSWAAALAALLYGLHPLQLPAAAWASALPDQLSALFSLESLRAYLARPGGRRQLRLAWCLFLLSALCRWKGAALPAVMLAIDGALLGRRAWREKLPFFALAAFVIAANAAAKAGYAYELAADAGVVARGLLLFLWKTLWPGNLLPIYSLHSLDTMRWPGPAAVLAVAALAALVWRLKRPAATAAVVAYALLLLPPLLYAQHGVTLAFAHHALLAVTPFYALLAAGLARLGRAGVVLGLVLAAALALQSRALLPSWGDGVLFWKRALALDPACRAAYHNLAFELSRRGRNDEALFYLEEQLRYNPADENARAGARVLRDAGARSRPYADKKDIIGP